MQERATGSHLEVVEFSSHGTSVGNDGLRDRLVLSVAEAAALIGMGKTKFWQLVWSGDMPHIRKGRWVGIPKGELTEWIRKNSS